MLVERVEFFDLSVRLVSNSANLELTVLLNEVAVVLVDETPNGSRRHRPERLRGLIFRHDALAAVQSDPKVVAAIKALF
jgi:TATA-box binding protein (TBP) (component of TFIID and TFIIIB)